MRKPQDFALIAYAAFVVLSFALKPVTDLLVSKWLEALLERMGVDVAALSDAVPPMLLAGLVLWLLTRYLRRHYEIELNRLCEPRIVLLDQIDIETDLDPDGHYVGQRSYLNVKNIGASILERCLVKLEEGTDPEGKIDKIYSALPTPSRSGDETRRRFALSGEEQKRILFSVHDGRQIATHDRVYMPTEAGDYTISRGTPFWISIAAASENGKTVRRILRVEVDKNYRVSIAWDDQNSEEIGSGNSDVGS